MSAVRHASLAVFVPHAGCPHACSFCDQRRISGATHVPDAAKVREVCESFIKSRRPDTVAEIAFFGGSFTAIPRDITDALLAAAYLYVQSGDFTGIRVSTRPDAMSEEIVDNLKNYGVTVVELGAQSMDDAVLEANMRGHTADDVRTAAMTVRAAGLKLGLQMMTGLYHSDDAADIYTARELAALSPDMVRVYPTVVVEGTRLAQLYRQGEYSPPTLDGAVSLCAGLLREFEIERGIPVIRMGLHADSSLESNIIAGPWHPAFRELCEGVLFREMAEKLLRTAGRDVVLVVNPSDMSKLIGQRRCNIAYFAERGYNIKIEQDSVCERGRIFLSK